LLGVAPGRGVGPLFPKVYYVTGRGVRRLKESLSRQGKPWQPSRIDRRGRDANEGYAADRIIHEILATEFLLAVWQTIEGRPDLELLNVERRSLAKHPALRVVIDAKSVRLIPDAQFLFRYKGGGMCCCFLELDNGTMNAGQMAAKFARYATWSQSSQGRQYLVDLYRRFGAHEPKPMFRLLIVTRSRTGLDDDGRLASLLADANGAPVGLRERMWLTTVAALRKRQHDDRPLEASVWLRSGDQRRPADSLPTGEEIARGQEQSLFPAVR
jgi:hypothetical protein